MAGDKLVDRLTTVEDGIIGHGGAILVGFPITDIIVNGNIEDGDEWALFRLTDDGLIFYNEGAEFRAGIMGLRIKDKLAVVELSPRYTTEELAIDAWSKLSREERARTLIRSVRPKK